MRLEEANELQKLVATSHPWLEVDIKKIEDGGRSDRDAWVCYIETKHCQWYMWDPLDWLAVKIQRAKALEKFTEEGRKSATENWHKSRNANKKKGKVA